MTRHAVPALVVIVVACGLAAALSGASLRAAEGSGRADERSRKIVARHLEARGGAEALAAIRDVKYLQRIEEIGKLAGGGIAVQRDFLRRGKHPGDLQVRSVLQMKIGPRSVAQVRVWDGEKAWAELEAAPPMPIAPEQAATLTAYVQIDDLFLGWEDAGLRLRYLREVEVGGEACDEIEVTRTSGGKLVPKVSRCAFSRKTGLLVRWRWRLEGREGARMFRYRKYEPISFRDAGGKTRKVLYPVKRDLLNRDLPTPDNRQEFRDVVINGGLDDALFRPGSKAGLEPIEE